MHIHFPYECQNIKSKKASDTRESLESLKVDLFTPYLSSHVSQSLMDISNFFITFKIIWVKSYFLFFIEKLMFRNLLYTNVKRVANSMYHWKMWFEVEGLKVIVIENKKYGGNARFYIKIK